MPITATISIKVKVADREDAALIAESLREFAQDAMDWVKIDPQPEVEIIAYDEAEGE